MKQNIQKWITSWLHKTFI